jgi:hypothetical protein
MFLAIDELWQSSHYRQRTYHAIPARSDHTGVAPFAPPISRRMSRHAYMLLLTHVDWLFGKGGA